MKFKLPKKKWLVVGAIVIAVVALLVWRGAAKGKDEGPRTAEVTRQEVVQDVTFTGRLQSKEAVAVGVDLGGLVQEVMVQVGDEVQAGQALLRLDSSIAAAEAAVARANRASGQEAKRLASVKADQTLNDAKTINASTLERKRQVVRDEKKEYDQVKDVWEQTVRENGDEAAVSRTVYSTVLLAETAYKAAQKGLTEAVETVENNERAEQANAAIAQDAYMATTQTASGVAGLSSLQATEALARLRVSKGVVRSPISGLVSARNVELGEYAAAGSSPVSVVGVGNYELKAQVPETDAVKMTVGMQATITFDAFAASDEWEAEVVRVAPAAVMIEGVPTYEVVLKISEMEERFKPGLTANINVHAAREVDVLAVPRRAVVTQDGRQFVVVLKDDGETEEVGVTTGLAGSSGTVVISSGLNGGERVVVDVRNLEE